jgi:serine/threonine protein kinase
MDTRVGKSIDRYHIIEWLGEGGMATVYKAFDTRLERDVAIKFIRRDIIADAFIERVLERFEREARALARFSHANIVQIHDYGKYEGVPYLVMEYLPSGTLREQTGRPMPPQEAAALLLSVARALEYAHGRDVIHRDVKPSNVLIDDMGITKLTDFGIAKILETEHMISLTETGIGLGTPEYMAPEQCLGQKVDHRVDIYSLGVVLYELVTGRRPFRADTPMAVLFKQVRDPLPRPRDFVPGLPEAVEKVLFKALAKKPQDRYSDMSRFADALESLTKVEVKPKDTTLVYPQEAPEKVTKVEVETVPDATPRIPSVQFRERPAVSTAIEHEKQKDLDVPRRDVPPKVGRKVPAWVWLVIGGGLIGVTILILVGVVLMSQGSLGDGILAFLAAGTTTVTSADVYPSTETGIPLSMDTKTPTSTVTQINTSTPQKAYSPTPEEISSTPMVSSPTPVGDTPTPTAANTSQYEIGSMLVSEVDDMVMVYVPAGEFLMGSTDDDLEGIVEDCRNYCTRSDFDHEQPQHTVYLDAFWIDSTEVINAMFVIFLKEMGDETVGKWISESEYTDIYREGERWLVKNGMDHHPMSAGRVPTLIVNGQADDYQRRRSGRKPPGEQKAGSIPGGMLPRVQFY